MAVKFYNILKGLLFLIGFTLVLSGCEDNGQVTIAQEIDTMKTDTVVLRNTAGLKPKLALTKTAKEASKNWRKYSAIVTHTDQLENVTFLNFKEEIAKAASLFLQQEETVSVKNTLWPEKLNTPAIRARMLVIETKVKILSALSAKQSPEIAKIEEEVTALKNAVQDLNLQINERFAITVEEMLEEIEKAEKEAQKKVINAENKPSGKPEIINIQKQ